MTTRESLHRLLDELHEEELDAARSLLERVRAAYGDPVLLTALAAPDDDEPVTAEDLAALAQPVGKGVPHEEILRELDL